MLGSTAPTKLMIIDDHFTSGYITIIAGYVIQTPCVTDKRVVQSFNQYPFNEFPLHPSYITMFAGYWLHHDYN